MYVIHHYLKADLFLNHLIIVTKLSLQKVTL